MVLGPVETFLKFLSECGQFQQGLAKAAGLIYLSAVAKSMLEMSQKGERAELQGFCGSAEVVERLKELGFHRGLALTYLGQAPFQGPKIFQVGSTLVLALRDEEAQCALIESSL